MARALKEFEIEGVKTLIPFHKAIMASEQWAKGETCRDLIEDRRAGSRASPRPRLRRPTRTRPEIVARDYVVEVSGKRFSVTVHGEALASNGAAPAATAPSRSPSASASPAAAAAGGDTLASPMQGNVFKVLVEQGADVEEGALVCIIEAMKMENEITAHKAGKIAELPISEGDAVTAGDTLAVITSG